VFLEKKLLVLEDMSFGRPQESLEMKGVGFKINSILNKEREKKKEIVSLYFNERN